MLQRLAGLYNAQGWPVTVKDGAFTAPYSAPSAGPPPWDVYEFTLTTAFGVASPSPTARHAGVSDDRHLRCRRHA